MRRAVAKNISTISQSNTLKNLLVSGAPSVCSVPHLCSCSLYVTSFLTPPESPIVLLYDPIHRGGGGTPLFPFLFFRQKSKNRWSVGELNRLFFPYLENFMFFHEFPEICLGGSFFFRGILSYFQNLSVITIFLRKFLRTFLYVTSFLTPPSPL